MVGDARPAHRRAVGRPLRRRGQARAALARRGVAFPQATHTITQTRHWLVLADTAYKVDLDEVLGAGDRTVANNPDGPLVLVRKDALDAAPHGTPVRGAVFRIAPEVNHFYAAYDDSAGIRVVMEHTPASTSGCT
nr:hypothetical protein GCM10020093_058680 [Planobispora longispora]